jgi:segregation and condensation protein A
MSFRALTSSLVERLEVVVRFLALLELFKQGLVDIAQAHAFGDIDIVWIGGDGADDELVLASIDAYDG